MPDHSLQGVLHHIRHWKATQTTAALSDHDLLERFVADRDEAAFTALVERHGSMVLGVCRRVLRHCHDAEDACQATFLILARKAASIRKKEALASWLHGVAYHVASRLKRDVARRGAREARCQRGTVADVAVEVSWRELLGLLDDELARLPERLRCPLILCYLEGKTRDEAAQQLGWSLGTLRGRLERGRECLRARLVRRGLTLSATLFAGVLAEGSASAALPPAFVVLTVNAGLLFAAGQIPVAGGFSVQAVALAEGVLRTMFVNKLKMATVVLVALAVLSFGTAALTRQVLAEKPAVTAAQPVRAEQPADPPPKDKKETADLPAKPKKDDAAKPIVVSGIVQAVDADRNALTLARREGDGRFTVARDAKIEIDGKPGSLAALPVGANVTLSQFADAETAGSLRAEGWWYFGAPVKAVDATKNTITIKINGNDAAANALIYAAKHVTNKDPDGEKTFAVAADAFIMVDGKNCKLAAVPPGAFVNMGLAADQETVRSIGADGPYLGGCGGSLVKAIDVEKRTITFDDKAMAEVAGKTFTLAEDANIAIDGKPAKLTDLPVGCYVNVGLHVDQQMVGQVHARGPSDLCDCGGTMITAVDVERRTITFDDKTKAKVSGKTYAVAANANITIDGKPGNLADLPTGSYLSITLRVDQQTIGSIFAQGPPAQCECGGSLVKAVDAEKNTITFDDKARSEVAGKTFTVAKDANIAIDAKPGKLADLPPGSYATIRFNVDKQTVGSIFAQGPPVPGVGVVKAVDATKNLITVENKTYPVAANANIVIDGKAVNLAGVPTGAYVSLRLCVDQRTVGTIFHTKAP